MKAPQSSKTTVFLSYARLDYFFAELADIKSAEAGIELWRDQGQIRAGEDWRQKVELGISESIAVLVALSERSSQSAYVTFEWAYALGKGKAVIPIKLEECEIHPRLKIVQYLDFSIARALPWETLVERINEIESAKEPELPKVVALDKIASDADSSIFTSVQSDNYANAIINYLNQRGYQSVSFERLRQRLDPNLTDQQFKEIIARNPSLFRSARIKGGKPGLAKRIP
jgi:hypothetical protein